MIGEVSRPPRVARGIAAFWPPILRLAVPVALSRVGVIVLAVVNVAMVGRADTTALAAFSLGYAIFTPLLVGGIGCMLGIIATTARMRGTEPDAVPAVGLRGLHWGLAVGVFVSLLLFVLAEPLLRLIGHAPQLVTDGAAAARLLAPGALFQLVFVAATFYLEGTGRARPGLIAMAAANVINFVAGSILVYGHLGFPALGATGAAIGATIARLAMAVGLVIYMLRLPEFRELRGRGLTLWGPGGWDAGREMRRIGYAGGAATLFETMAFAALVQMAGLLGPTALAAYTIAHNTEALIFMMALGISVATAVYVGEAAGAGHRFEAASAAFAGLIAAMGFVGAIGILLATFATTTVSVYTTDAALITRAGPLLSILAVSMVFDAGQVVLGQANRALGDSWMTTGCFFIAFFCVMIPLGYLLAFHTSFAEAGLFIATAVGCTTAVMLLFARFRYLVSRI